MGSVILIKPNQKLNYIYLLYLFKGKEFIINLLKLSSASAQQAIYLTHLKKLIIPIPPIELQNKFAQIVEQVEQLKEYQNKSKEEIDNLFNVLMQQAFRGEL